MTYLLRLTPPHPRAPATLELTAKPAIGELLRLRDVGDYRITDVVHDVSVDQHAHTSASVEIRAVRWEPDTKRPILADDPCGKCGEPLGDSTSIGGWHPWCDAETESSDV